MVIFSGSSRLDSCFLECRVELGMLVSADNVCCSIGALSKSVRRELSLNLVDGKLVRRTRSTRRPSRWRGQAISLLKQTFSSIDVVSGLRQLVGERGALYDRLGQNHCVQKHHAHTSAPFLINTLSKPFSSHSLYSSRSGAVPCRRHSASNNRLPVGGPCAGISAGTRG